VEFGRLGEGAYVEIGGKLLGGRSHLEPLKEMRGH
jgi:hypothetical protein